MKNALGSQGMKKAKAKKEPVDKNWTQNSCHGLKEWQNSNGYYR